MSQAKLFILDFAKKATIAQCGQRGVMEPDQVSSYFSKLVTSLTEVVEEQMSLTTLQALLEERSRDLGMTSDSEEKILELGKVSGDTRSDDAPGVLPEASVVSGAGLGEQDDHDSDTGLENDKSPTKKKTEPLIECLECGERLTQITNTHLSKHDLTVREYRKKYELPDIPLTGRNMDSLRIYQAYAGSQPNALELDQKTVHDSLHGNPDFITCLICQQKMRIMSRKHLLSHGFDDKDEYLRRFGLPRGTPLCSENVSKMKKQKIEEHEIWRTQGKTQKPTKK